MLFLSKDLTKGQYIGNTIIDEVFKCTYTGECSYTLRCSCGRQRGVNTSTNYKAPRYCYSCKKRLMSDEKPSLIGKVFGDYRVTENTGSGYIVECKNYTKKFVKQLKKLTTCCCLSCNPNRGFHTKPGSYYYSKILIDGHDGSLKTYEVFINEVFNLKDDPSRVLIKKDVLRPWGVTNFYWSDSTSTKWGDILHSCTKDYTFTSVYKNHVLCKCNKCNQIVKKNKGKLFKSYTQSKVLKPHNCTPVRSRRTTTDVYEDRKKQFVEYTKLNSISFEAIPATSRENFYVTNNISMDTYSVNLFTFYKISNEVIRKYARALNLKERFTNNQDKIDLKYGKNNLSLISFTAVDKPIVVKCKLCSRERRSKSIYALFSNKYSCTCTAKYSIDHTKPCDLYYVKVTTANKTYYKIGITTQTLKQRFKHACEVVDIIKIWKFDTAAEAMVKELEVLETYKEYQVSADEQVLVGNGRTECFYIDVLELDTK